MPSLGIAAYALMATGGDMGASIAPQLLGVITDTVSESDWGATLSQTLSIAPDELGMKVGMIFGAMFPLIGVVVLICMKKFFKNHAL